MISAAYPRFIDRYHDGRPGISTNAVFQQTLTRTERALLKYQ